MYDKENETYEFYSNEADYVGIREYKLWNTRFCRIFTSVEMEQKK